ncbi:MAG: hypothetical protein ABSF64_25385 [Bryobacteraceae bacterium]|jgi:virginiamycin B lyase
MSVKIAALFLSLPAISCAQQVAIGSYALRTNLSYPSGITAGPDGALWFAESFANQIGRITTAGSITEFPLPSSFNGPGIITTGPDGALWFGADPGVYSSTDAIGRITTAGAVTMYQLPGPATTPFAITSGPDGALWFTGFSNTLTGSEIGRITTVGAVTIYATPTEQSGPWGITAGPDGALWFTELYANNIGRITTAGAITEYPLPYPYSYPYGIVAGPDGALWFTEQAGNRIGRISTSGVITEYTIPTPFAEADWIIVGPDGALWFTEYNNQYQIGRVTTAGAFTEYAMPTGRCCVYGITAGPDGEIWLTEPNPQIYPNEIAELFFVTANLAATPATGRYHSALSFTGSGFAPGEKVQVYESGVGSKVLASATADSSGSVSTAEVRMPQSEYGPRIFVGVGQSSGKLGAAAFAMEPRLVLSTDAGAPGASVTAEGYGFDSFEFVDIYWDDPYILLGTVQVDWHSSFTGAAAFGFQVPKRAALGANSVLGIGQTSKAVGPAAFTVE